MKIDISVTKRDIKRGKREDSTLCPITYAVRRSLGIKLNQIIVGSGGIMVEILKGRTRLKAKLPEEARGFVTIFDASGKAEPLKFKLDFKKGKAA
jgi:hypothetical protein